MAGSRNRRGARTSVRLGIRTLGVAVALGVTGCAPAPTARITRTSSPSPEPSGCQTPSRLRHLMRRPVRLQSSSSAVVWRRLPS